jgi:hypothetical protein
MARYACINDGDLSVRREVEGDTEFRRGTPPALPRKPFHWVPVIVVKPSYSSATQIRTGPVEVVTSTELTRTWTVRDKTARELEAEGDTEDEDWFMRMKPLLVALNEGTFLPGSNYTKAKIKAIIRASRK